MIGFDFTRKLHILKGFGYRLPSSIMVSSTCNGVVLGKNQRNYIRRTFTGISCILCLESKRVLIDDNWINDEAIQHLTIWDLPWNFAFIVGVCTHYKLCFPQNTFKKCHRWERWCWKLSQPIEHFIQCNMLYIPSWWDKKSTKQWNISKKNVVNLVRWPSSQ